MDLFGPSRAARRKARRDTKCLVKALKHRDREMNLAASVVLEQLGWQLGNSDVFDESGRPLYDGAVVRTAIAEALGGIGDRRAVGVLVASLNNRSLVPDYWQHYLAAEDSVRKAAAGALGKIGDRRAVGALIAALNEPFVGAPHEREDEDAVRRAFAGALGKIGDRRAIAPLISALKDPPARASYQHEDEVVLRKTFVHALDKLEWRPDQGEGGAWYWVTKGDWSRCVAIGALAVRPLIAALEEDDRSAREAAADAITEIGTSAVVPLIAVLKGPWLSAREDSLRESCAKILGRIGDQRAVQPLLAVLKDDIGTGYDGVHKAVAEALDKLGWKPAEDEEGARYWIAKGNWKKCVSIGVPAIEPLKAVARLPRAWGEGNHASGALESIYRERKRET